MYLLKHKNNTDVAIEILKSFYIREKQEYSLKVLWWNIGQCHEPYCMGITQRIRIPKANMPDWQPITAP
jgi:hypothetical protein